MVKINTNTPLLPNGRGGQMCHKGSDDKGNLLQVRMQQKSVPWLADVAN